MPVTITFHLNAEDSSSRDLFHEAERELVLSALDRASGNVSKAAKLLGINRRTVYRVIARHGLKNVRLSVVA